MTKDAAEPATTNPKVFISYAWSSSDHMDWVISLASQLRSNGVDAILDKWMLREGQDAHAFMERMVTDPDIHKVIVICDRVYAEKSSSRAGGVGVESQIMSAEIYNKVDQTKFVAVVAERNDAGDPFLPPFFQTRIYIDLGEDADYAYNFERLLRWCFDKPLDLPPEIGPAPQFLDAAPIVAATGKVAPYGKAAVFRQISAAVSDDSTSSLLSQVVDVVQAEDTAFPSDQAPEDVVVERIDAMRPLANRALVAVDQAISKTDGSVTAIHGFLEQMLDLASGRQAEKRGRGESDHLKFLAHYLFVQTVAGYARHEKFEQADDLLERPFYREDERALTGRGLTYLEFLQPLDLLERYNSKQAQRRLSLHADLIQRACEGTQFTFGAFTQADFLLWIRTALTGDRHPHPRNWWPISGLYTTFTHGAFPLFVRSESQRYWIRTVPLHHLDGKAAADGFLERVKGDVHFVPKWEYARMDPLTLMNWDGIKRHLGYQ